MLNQLPKIHQHRSKRIGRGHGSGRGGHTSSRGAKGDKARGNTKLLFEGTKTKKSLIKRLPFIRGKDKFRPTSVTTVLSLTKLSVFTKNEPVTLETLVDKGLINRVVTNVKILGNGEITTPLQVYVRCSGSAVAKIEHAGGEVFPAISQTR